MKTTIQKWGNSLAVRIPKSFAIEADLHQDTEVDVSLVGGQIVVKVREEKPCYTLHELVDQITDENLHPETDWGPPVGKEVW